MKIGRWARALLVAAPVLVGFMSGCGNFWQAPSGSTSSTCTTDCTTATSGNFYILNSPGSGSPTIVGESIVSGTLTALSGSPWSLEGAPYSMAIASNGNFLCVSTTSGVFAYPISSGKLGTPVVVSTDLAEAIQVDATDSWLIEALPTVGGVTLGAVPISTTTGASTGSELTASFSVASAALQPNEMVISGDNSNIFVALGAGGTLVAPFSSTAPFPSGVNATTIAVANSSNGSALSVAVDPGTTPRLFYIGETDADSAGTSGGLRAFNYSSLGSSTLTQATNSPIASGGLAPNFILPINSTSGDYVYVANGTGATTAGNITGITVTSSSSTYSLSAGSTVAAGAQPRGLAEDSTSTFVLAVGSLGSPYFDAYTFDTTTAGQLDSQITSTTAAGSIAIVAAP